MNEIQMMTWLAVSYGLILALVAHGIDHLARRAHGLHEKMRTPGFTYHEDHDAWLCPQDQWLWPQSFDPQNRVMRYRGSPTVCNSCPVKDMCTSSSDGREISRSVDTWPASESARFHRGIACAISVLAAAWPITTIFAAGSWTERLLLIATVLVIALVSLPLWSHLRHTPADPHGVLVQTLDENLADRTAAADALARRKAVYASDRREAAQDAH